MWSWRIVCGYQRKRWKCTDIRWCKSSSTACPLALGGRHPICFIAHHQLVSWVFMLLLLEWTYFVEKTPTTLNKKTLALFKCQNHCTGSWLAQSLRLVGCKKSIVGESGEKLFQFKFSEQQKRWEESFNKSKIEKSLEKILTQRKLSGWKLEAVDTARDHRTRKIIIGNLN